MPQIQCGTKYIKTESHIRNSYNSIQSAYTTALLQSLLCIWEVLDKCHHEILGRTNITAKMRVESIFIKKEFSLKY